MKLSYLAIIPARGGSKRIPNKNILDLGGKPLIKWTIDAALKCNKIDKIVVSSDSEKILKIASSFEVDCLKRNKGLAEDTTPTASVVLDILKKDKYSNYTHFILLQPTSPFRNETHILNAINLIEAKKALGIISLSKSNEHPEHMNVLPSNLDMKSFIKTKHMFTRTQDFQNYYRLNGAIYICNINSFKLQKTFFLNKKQFAYIMSAKESLDIDTIDDFNYAKFMISEMLKNN